MSKLLPVVFATVYARLTLNDVNLFSTLIGSWFLTPNLEGPPRLVYLSPLSVTSTSLRLSSSASSCILTIFPMSCSTIPSTALIE